jgi:DNA invertase Pin-like site-specific DNA recombinase
MASGVHTPSGLCTSLCLVMSLCACQCIPLVYSECMAKRIKAGDPKVAVGYVRVSTEEQSLGPQAQRSAIENWAAGRGVRVVAVFEDFGISGGAPAEKRPGLLAALGALRTLDAGMLVAAKRDRIARDTVIAAMVEQAVGRAGAMLTTADGASDGAGPEGQLMRGIVDVFAAYERGVIKSRTRAALAVKRTRGERTGQIPFGYALAADGVHLEENPAEQSIIGRIRALRAAGLSLRAVTAECARAGLVSRAARPFALTQIARLCG